jgi:hypothetical protein
VKFFKGLLIAIPIGILMWIIIVGVLRSLEVLP